MQSPSLGENVTVVPELRSTDEDPNVCMHAVDRELSFKGVWVAVSSLILPEQWQKQLFFVILN